ncbi:MAG: NAD(P)-dependent oxidoreductase [bacterium]
MSKSDRHPQRILFTAPHDFLGGFADRYRPRLEMTFREMWFPHELDDRYDVHAWITNPGQHFVVTTAILDRFPNLRVLATPSTGNNHVDQTACRNRGIAFISLLDDRSSLEQISASSEFTFLHILNGLRRFDLGIQELRGGSWRLNEPVLRGRELQGKRVGLVGFGRIGRRLARYCQAFGAKVAFHDPYVRKALPSIARTSELGELWSKCDVIVVCCSLTDETRSMLGGELIRTAPKGAVIVNTARGEVFNEHELVATLETRPDLTFTADVLTGEVENRQYESPLMGLVGKGQVVLTPHMAGATVESQRTAAKVIIALVERALTGTAQ